MHDADVLHNLIPPHLIRIRRRGNMLQDTCYTPQQVSPYLVKDLPRKAMQDPDTGPSAPLLLRQWANEPDYFVRHHARRLP
jgi:hypothetical protein